MRKRLDEKLTPLPLPEGVEIIRFDADLHKASAHSLLVDAYSNGFGHVSDPEQWWREISEDSEYDPSLLILAADWSGQILGLIHCWSGSFVKDLAVSTAAQRSGIGSALLHHSFIEFHDRGAKAVDLKVMAANLPAIALYRTMGMVQVSESA
jgi:ribosomal protein S18 acetylase RimI-like enzyme